MALTIWGVFTPTLRSEWNLRATGQNLARRASATRTPRLRPPAESVPSILATRVVLMVLEVRRVAMAIATAGLPATILDLLAETCILYSPSSFCMT